MRTIYMVKFEDNDHSVTIHNDIKNASITLADMLKNDEDIDIDLKDLIEKMLEQSIYGCDLFEPWLFPLTDEEEERAEQYSVTAIWVWD